jgi:lysophospholipase L1-like esterase
MARIGGRAAGWAAAASAVAATALLVAAGAALVHDDPGFRAVAVGAAASSSEVGTGARPTPSTTASRRDAVARSSPGGPSTSTGSITRGTPQPSSGPPSPAAAPSASPAAVERPDPEGPEYPTWPGATPDAPFVSFVGDSWTDGAGATDGVGYAHLTGRLLGWAHRVLGVGGSGYVVGGTGDVPFDERIAPAVAGDPDVVVIQGSINEAGTPSPELAAAVADTLTRLVRVVGADTAVVVVGASHVPGMPVPSVDQVNDVLRAEAARQGLLFVDVAAEVWSDPADPTIWADPYHVNDAGAAQIAGRLAPLLRAVVAG